MSATHDETIYILDEVTAKSGRGPEFLAFYMERFAPGARDRGMTLLFSWIAPAMWLDDQPNTLMFVWTCKGAPGWWAMQRGGKRNPEVRAFWRDAEPLIDGRSRRFFANIADIGALNDV